MPDASMETRTSTSARRLEVNSLAACLRRNDDREPASSIGTAGRAWLIASSSKRGERTVFSASLVAVVCFSCSIVLLPNLNGTLILHALLIRQERGHNGDPLNRKSLVKVSREHRGEQDEMPLLWKARA